MPKQKSHKGSKKRLRVTASGKIKFKSPGRRHLLSHKTGKRKRQLRAPHVEGGVVAQKYILAMGGNA